MGKHASIAEVFADPELAPALHRLIRIQTQIAIEICQREEAERAAATAEDAEQAIEGVA